MLEKTVIRIHGKPVSCEIHGEGPTTLLIAGPADLFKINNNFPITSLTSHCRIIFADLWKETSDDIPNYLNKNTEKLTLEDLVEELEEVRQAFERRLGVKKIIIFGHSAAGILALEYTLQYPQHCQGGIIISCPPFWRQDLLDKTVEEYITLNASEERKNQYNRDKEDCIPQSQTDQQRFKHSFFKNRTLFWKDYHVDVEKMWHGYTPNVEKINHYFTNILRHYDARERPTPDIPILWLQGLYDYSVPYYTLVENAEAWLKDSKVSPYITEVGHYLMIEDPENFTELVNEYLLKLQGAYSEPFSLSTLRTEMNFT